MRGNDRLVLVAHFVIPAKAGAQRPFAAATSLYTGLPGWTGPTALIRHVSSQSGGRRITGGNGGPVPTHIVRLKLQGSRLART